MVNEVFYDEGYIQDVDPNQSQNAYDNNNQDIDINADLEEVIHIFYYSFRRNLLSSLHTFFFKLLPFPSELEPFNEPLSLVESMASAIFKFLINCCFSKETDVVRVSSF
jgi:hypothetical protein